MQFTYEKYHDENEEPSDGSDWYEEVTVDVPVHFVVCDSCEGRGSYVNPNIDRNGLSREDFEEDPDFAEDYMSGHYDMTCEQCDGMRVVPVPDDGVDPEVLEAIENKVRGRLDYHRECEAEMRYCYGSDY